jgi:hypothetical protein
LWNRRDAQGRTALVIGSLLIGGVALIAWANLPDDTSAAVAGWRMSLALLGLLAVIPAFGLAIASRFFGRYFFQTQNDVRLAARPKGDGLLLDEPLDADWDGVTHHITVYDVQPQPGGEQFDEYFAAMCGCGWLGECVPTEAESRANAATHSSDIQAALEYR